MITKNEINRLAIEQKVRTTTIDKDWVLGHFLDAIYTVPECRENLIFKIAAIGIIVAVLNQLLIRSGREEQAMMTTLAGLIVVLMMIIGQISVLFDTIKSLFDL